MSIVLHEIAHGYVALKNGDDTAKRMGRLSFNPLVHFEPTGFLMMILLGFGFAKPVPVNINNFKKKRLGIFTVAIAGVSVNIILAFISIPLWLLFYRLIPQWEGNIVFANFFWFMALINVSLFLFNLLPIFPLDGFRIIESFTKHNNRFVNFMRRRGIFILLGLFLWSFILGLFINVANFSTSAVTVTSPMGNRVVFLDPLSLYIIMLRDGIIWLFENFWRLFIR